MPKHQQELGSFFFTSLRGLSESCHLGNNFQYIYILNQDLLTLQKKRKKRIKKEKEKK